MRSIEGGRLTDDRDIINFYRNLLNQGHCSPPQELGELIYFDAIIRIDVLFHQLYLLQL